MKILLSDQIRELDASTIREETISSVDLMERASAAAAEWLDHALGKEKPFTIICGPGNNGGDGLAIARILHTRGYNIEAFLTESGQYSSDCLANKNRLSHLTDIKILSPENLNSIEFPADSVILDALFGSGLNRKPEGIYKLLIEKINASGAKIVSVDIPSGLSADGVDFHGLVIKAAFTLSFQLPKLGFLLPTAESYTGKWQLLNIGLSKKFINNCPTSYFYTTSDDILHLVRPRPTFSHKGSFGKALIIAGKYGSIGAAVLATEACYRSGAGLVTSYTPGCGYNIIQSAVPEALSITDPDFYEITDFPDLHEYNGIGIGPGLSEGPKTEKALKDILENCKTPLVLDASALNIISRNKDLLQLIPPGSVLTPHPKEFQRLVGPWHDELQRLHLQKQLAKEISSIIIVKGAYTAIADTDGNVYFNSTGNAGMATGGSGDVLTGLLTGLLAQGYDSLSAARLGVYIHGYAGDKAAAGKSQEAMIAGDITDHLGDFYLDHKPNK